MKHAWVSRVGMVTLVGTLVLAGNTYTASGAKPVPPAPAVPRVLDANDKLVGLVIGTTAQPTDPTIVLNIPVPSIVVQVKSDRFLGNATPYFTTSNCSGQPYFLAAGAISQPHMFPIVVVVSGIVYGPRANSTPVTIAFSSNLSFDSGVCNTTTIVTSSVIADPIIDLNTLFTSPYRFVYP